MTRVITFFVAVALACATSVASRAQGSPTVFINEFHYDNTGTDTGEFIEIAGPAGTDLSAYSIVLYNGAGGAPYDTDTLAGTILDQQNGFGTVSLLYPSNGIQNGSPDGIALVHGTTVIQFLSYEGAFTAVGGPANGITSVDIGRSEGGAELAGLSLQLQGTGTTYGEFTWSSAAIAATSGAVNTGQSFGGTPTVSLSINDPSVAEGDSGLANATFTVSLTAPAGSGGVSFKLDTEDGTATAGEDYEALATTATIPEGSSTHSFSVSVIGDTSVEVNETFFVHVTDVIGAVVADGDGTATISNDDGGPAPAIVINEVDSDTPATDTAEFVELYDGGAGGTPLDGLVVVLFNGSDDRAYAAIDLDGRVTHAAGYFTLGNAAVPNVDVVLADGLVQNGADAVALYVGSATDFPNGTLVTTGNLVDAIVYDTADADDAGLLGLLNAGQPQVDENAGGSGATNSNQRCPNGAGGARNTTSYTQLPPTPGGVDGCAPPAVARTISEIQGVDVASPFVNDNVITTGLVTGRKSNGFFMQMPVGDGISATSDAIFVFTSNTPTVVDAGILRTVELGDALQVTGTVTEFRRGSDARPGTLTQLAGAPSLTLLSEGNVLPAALDVSSLYAPAASSRSAQLEQYESMLVMAGSVTVVAPTNGFGEFYAVMADTPRPFREPGVLVGDLIPAEAPSPTDIDRFDGNFERVMIESDEQINAGGVRRTALQVASGATVTGAWGPLDYAFDEYRVQVDATAILSASGGITAAVPVPVAASNEFTVASANLLNFFPPNPNDPLQVAAFNNRLAKASLLIRDVLRTPAILGVIEIGDLNVLQQLRNRVNADAGTSYEAYLLESDDDAENDQDVGYLVDLARVAVVGAPIQLFKGKTFEFAGATDVLHDRPPLVLEADILRPGTTQRLPVTVILNHLRSLIDVDSTAPFLVNGQPSGFTVGARVREKRRLAAEDLADAIELREHENLIVLGDLNAFEFNDGLVDVVATLRGTPAPPEEVVEPSTDRWDHALFNLVDEIADPDQHYSYVFEGNAQVLDHVLVNSPMLAHLNRFQYARNNADFPAALTSDFSRPERFSDHDVPVAYFAFPAIADLSVTATVGSGTVETGATFSYSVGVSNLGPDPAASVTLSVPTHANLRFDSLTAPPGWECTLPIVGAMGPVSCTTASLAASASATFVFSARLDCAVADAALITQPLSVSSTTPDLAAANNTSIVAIDASNPPPVISGVLTPIVVFPIPGATATGALVNDVVLGTPSVSDNCAGATLTRAGVPAGNLFPVGITTITYTAADAGGAITTASSIVKVLSAVESLDAIEDELAIIVETHPRTTLARRVSEALRDVRLALMELRESPPDVQRATAHIISALGTLEDVGRRGLLDAVPLRSLLNRLTGVSWLLARQAIDDAVSRGVAPVLTAFAKQLVQGGNTLAAAGRYQLAAVLYWAAVSLTRYA